MISRFMRASAAFLFVGGLLAATPSCNAIVNSDVKPKGFGEQCTSTDECHAGRCDDGLCVASCAGNSECPLPTECFGGVCSKPLNVGAVWVGVVAGGEGWTLTHHQGMQEAAAALPYVDWDFKQAIATSEDIKKVVNDYATGADGRPPKNVVILNSFSQRDTGLELAKTYPNITFLNCAGYQSNSSNFGWFAAHGEQAWYIAGRVAAMRTKTNKIGYVISFITPETIRHASAFFLGARSANPAVELLVEWMGFWYDYESTQKFEYSHPELTNGETRNYFREEITTLRLLEDGADVIGHGADNQRTVRLIENLYKGGNRTFNVANPSTVPALAWSFSNDNNNAFREISADGLPNGPALTTCLGSPYWNWGPMYTRLLQQVHQGTWSARNNPNDPLIEDQQRTITGFTLNPTVGIDDTVLSGIRAEVARNNWQWIFQGDYEGNGQRDADGDGRADEDQKVTPSSPPMSDREYSSFCWFPKGVKERIDPTKPAAAMVNVTAEGWPTTDPSGRQVPNQRDAIVPDKARVAGDNAFLDDIQGPPGAPRGVALDCTLNL